MVRMGTSAVFGSTLTGGAALVASARVITMALGLVVNMLLARILPLDQLGAYFLLASFAQVGALVAMGGASQSAVPVVSGAPEGSERPALRGLLIYATTTAAICGLLVFALFEPVSARIGLTQTQGAMAALTALWMVGRALSQLCAHVLRAMDQLALFGLLETLLFNVMFCLVVLVFFLFDVSAGLEQTVLASALIALFGVVAGGVPLWRLMRALPQQAGADLRRAAVLSAPLWVMVAANAALADAHLWIAGALGGEESAALFGAALRVVRLLGLPLLAVNLAIGPQAARLWREGRRDELDSLLRGAATVISGVSILLLVCLLLIGPSVLEVVFGPEFTAAWPAFVVLLCGQALNACTGLPVLLMTVSTAQRQVMVFSLIAGGAGIAASLYWGREDPVVGVAIGSALSVILINLLAVFYCYKRLGLRTLPRLGLPKRGGAR